MMTGVSDKNLFGKVVSGLVSGIIGSLLATPTDLVKIRLQGSAGRIQNGVYVSGLRKGYAPEYKNTFDAFRSIAKADGVKGLWKGATPTVIRAALITCMYACMYLFRPYDTNNAHMINRRLSCL